MTLLTYNSKYIVQSGVSASTTSSILSNDPAASKSFTLSSTKVVLAIYIANSAHTDINDIHGISNAVNIDGTDHSIMYDTGYDANYAMRNSCVWVGQLSAGSHTINGRIASSANGVNTTVTNRTLLIYVFNGDEFTYIENSTAQTTSANTYINDLYATTTVTPSASCKALVLYGLTNVPGATEWYDGKKICINVAGVDYISCEASKSSQSSTNYGSSLSTAYALSLTTGSTAIKGRFASNYNTKTVTACKHILCVLMLSNSTLVDIDSSIVQVSSNSSALVDDPDISITRTTGGELLALAQATKKTLTVSTPYGFKYGININSVDVAHSRSSPGYTPDAECNLVAFASSLSPANHTVRGRFATNYSTNLAKIDNRILIALWFPTSTTVEIASTVQGVGVSECTNFMSSSAEIVGFILKSADGLILKSDDGFVLTSGEVSVGSGGGFILKSADGFVMMSNDGLILKSSDIVPENLGFILRSADGLILKSDDGFVLKSNDLYPNYYLASTCSGSGLSYVDVLTFNSIQSAPTGAGSQSTRCSVGTFISSSIQGVGAQTCLNYIISGEILDSQVSGEGTSFAGYIVKQVINSSLYGAGTASASSTTSYSVSASIQGSGFSEASCIIANNISSTILGEGIEFGNIYVISYELDSLSSFLLGEGISTAGTCLKIELHASVSGIGVTTATAEILEAVINITSDVSGIGSSYVSSYIISTMSSAIYGIGYQDSTIFKWSVLYSYCDGAGSSSAALDSDFSYINLQSTCFGEGSSYVHLYVSSNIDFPLTVIIQKNSRLATIMKNVRTAVIDQ